MAETRYFMILCAVWRMNAFCRHSRHMQAWHRLSSNYMWI